MFDFKVDLPVFNFFMEKLSCCAMYTVHVGFQIGHLANEGFKAIACIM